MGNNTLVSGQKYRQTVPKAYCQNFLSNKRPTSIVVIVNNLIIVAVVVEVVLPVLKKKQLLLFIYCLLYKTNTTGAV